MAQKSGACYMCFGLRFSKNSTRETIPLDYGIFFLKHKLSHLTIYQNIC